MEVPPATCTLPTLTTADRSAVDWADVDAWLKDGEYIELERLLQMRQWASVQKGGSSLAALLGPSMSCVSSAHSYANNRKITGGP